MTEMLQWALRYAALGWLVFPLHSIRFDKKCGCGKADCASGPGKHPRTKWGHGQTPAETGKPWLWKATTDPGTIKAWWAKWPNAGIGCATGPSGLLVADADGPKGVETFRVLMASQPGSLCTARARTARGMHVFFRGEGKTRSNPETKLDARGRGGFVVLAPSPHVSGHVYRWEVEPWGDGAIAEAPAKLVAYSAGKGKRQGAGEGMVGGSAPPWADTGTAETEFTRRLARCLVDWAEVDRALASISPDVCMDEWIRAGMALHAAGDSGERWDQWSRRGQKYREGEPAYKWTTFKQVPDGVGLGSLFVIAKEYGYTALGRVNPGRGEEVMQIDAALARTKSPETRPPSDTDAAGAAHLVNGHNVFGETVNGTVHALPASFSEPAIRFPDVTEGGKVKATCQNARIGIRSFAAGCEHNEFHERYKIGGEAMKEQMIELTDDIVQKVRMMIYEKFGFDPGTNNTRDALVQECLMNSYHPIKDYFHSLKWDGIPRLDTWMARYLAAPDTPFNRAVASLCLIAAVRRIKQPGCKFDYITVLEGPEGRGKSTAIEILAGSDNFSDQTIISLDDRAQQEAVQGVWLYEIADLAGHSRTEVARVKAFASRTRDRARPAYGRVRVDKPRTCVFFATTDNDTYLKSQTGNRRFWPVKCGRVDLAGLRADRDQLWAEALEREKAGRPLFLDESLWGEAGKLQDSRMDRDPWDDMLADLEHSTKMNWCTKVEDEWRVTSKTLLKDVLELPSDRQTDVAAKRLAHVMRRLGWESEVFKLGGAPYRGYTKAVTP
jgi:hypothetical protein